MRNDLPRGTVITSSFWLIKRVRTCWRSIKSSENHVKLNYWDATKMLQAGDSRDLMLSRSMKYLNYSKNASPHLLRLSFLLFRLTSFKGHSVQDFALRFALSNQRHHILGHHAVDNFRTDRNLQSGLSGTSSPSPVSSFSPTCSSSIARYFSLPAIVLELNKFISTTGRSPQKALTSARYSTANS